MAKFLRGQTTRRVELELSGVEVKFILVVLENIFADLPDYARGHMSHQDLRDLILELRKAEHG